jgi:hypothetical protein
MQFFLDFISSCLGFNGKPINPPPLCWWLHAHLQVPKAREKKNRRPNKKRTPANLFAESQPK